MNVNSVLCNFIKGHADDWEALLEREYSVRVKREGDLAIFNYGFDCNFADPIVQEARGIIIDCKRLEVVCWPFRKFGNHNEIYADEIDWSTARVLEKVDGSIIKLWYDRAADKWQFSTNGTIRAESAPIGQYAGLTFGKVILGADNYGKIPFDALDRDCTYIFELVSPETQVVVKYNAASLYHIGTRNNISGEELEVDIGIKKPASYPLESLEQCLRAAAELNRDTAGDDAIESEGFVVVDGRWNRVKVKSPDYLMMHRLKQPVGVSKRDCIAMLLANDENIGIICEANAELNVTFKYYEYKLAELFLQADKLALLAGSLYREYSGDRGTVAGVIKRHPLASVAFRCLGTDLRGSDVLRGYPPERIARLIPDYAADDMYSLFTEA